MEHILEPDVALVIGVFLFAAFGMWVMGRVAFNRED
jgi:hypothetical protein